MVFIMAACTSTRYVPVESVRTEKEYAERWRVDTLTQSDTRLIYISGDTVIDWRDRWHERNVYVRDTVLVERTDSVAVPYPVPAELTRWERTKIDWGGWAMAVVVAMAVALVWSWKTKHKVIL